MPYLRPEACPAGWGRLDRTQREAFVRTLVMIHDAVSELATRGRSAGRSEPGTWLSKDRASRSAFISGGRGSGKTTVLASLIEAYEKPKKILGLDAASLEARDRELLVQAQRVRG